MDIITIVILLFLLLFLIVGVYAGRNTDTVSDYFVMSKQAPAYQITGTLIATNTSSVAFIGYVGDTVQGGALPMIAMFGATTITNLALGLWLGRYIYRMDLLTVPDFFSKRFPRKSVQLMSSFIVLFSMTFYLMSVLIATNI